MKQPLTVRVMVNDDDCSLIFQWTGETDFDAGRLAHCESNGILAQVFGHPVPTPSATSRECLRMSPLEQWILDAKKRLVGSTRIQQHEDLVHALIMLEEARKGLEIFAIEPHRDYKDSGSALRTLDVLYTMAWEATP